MPKLFSFCENGRRMREDDLLRSPKRNYLHQTVIVYQRQTNGTGVAGFILSLIALFMGWLPVLVWILWLLGLILSSAGVSRKPNGLAIAGIVISLISLALLLLISVGVASIFDSLIS